MVEGLFPVRVSFQQIMIMLRPGFQSLVPSLAGIIKAYSWENKQ